jgi:hypothetical protein
MKAARRRKSKRRVTKRIIYGPAWGAWIMRNIKRDLRSGALRINADGKTIH